MNEYKNELLKKCDISKGFSDLLTDTSLSLDFIPHNHVTDPIYNFDNKSFKFSTSDIQAKYFFRHLNAYFLLEKKLSDRDKEEQILASMIAFNQNPIDDLCNYLNSILQTSKLTIMLHSLKSYNFSNLVVLQRQRILGNQNFFINISLANNNDKDSNYLSNQINGLFNNNLYESKNKVSSTVELNMILTKIAEVYEFKNKSNADYETVVNSADNKNFVSSKPSPKYFDDDFGNIKMPESLKKTFNTLEDYFYKMNAKYQAMYDALDFDSKNCRYIRTLIYSIAYVTRDFNTRGSQYMKNITNIDVGWAVGDENNKNPSFYGKSELAKAFAAYYAFMNAEENPYTELIDNDYVREMDYNAIMLHTFIKRNGLSALLFEGEGMIRDVHKILKIIRSVITLLDTPITAGADLLGWIKGLVASLTNAAATIIDLSLSEVAKALFFVPVIPIGDKKYSLADIYNYVNFIRLICEHSESLDLGVIDREEFVEEAYNYLGIDKTSISKIGYFAYDKSLNSQISPFSNISVMFTNSYGDLFTAKEDLKLLYSLIQFGIQKHIYLTGDTEYEKNYNYSSIHLIGNTLSSLDNLEVFYIFNLYGINFYTLKDKLRDMDTEKMLTFNKQLYNLTMNYDHHDISFYEEYDKMDKSILYEKMLGHDFRHMRYINLISLMRNYYARVVKYNKSQLDSALFAANDISDVDDFFMRFIPSILELAKTFDIEVKTFKQIADFLGSFCNLITDVLFKKLYLNLRIDLTEIIKRYTDEMFKKLDFLKSDEFTVDLELGNNKFVRILDKIIYSLEQGGSLELDLLDKCFKGYSYGSAYGSGGYDNIDFGDGTIGDANQNGDYEIGSNYPSNPDYDGTIGYQPPEWEDKIILDYEKRKPQKPNSGISKPFVGQDEEIYLEYENNDRDKIVYENGSIIIEKPNGDRNVILKPDDKHHSFTEETSQKLPKDEFDKLVHIRDFIENVKDKEIVHLQNLIKKEQNKLENELNKKLPNYGIIQNINKNIQELTEELDSVKNKNRTMHSETIILKSFNPPIISNESNINSEYYYLNEFFNKESILDDIEEIVVKNDSPLTNYQITELLK